MTNLQDILYKVSIRSVRGERDRDVTALVTDSRQASPGSLFIAQRGTHIDGHQFIPAVIAAGATVIVAETLPETLQDNITYVQVEDSLAAAGIIAHNFYGQPSENLKLV